MLASWKYVRTAVSPMLTSLSLSTQGPAYMHETVEFSCLLVAGVKFCKSIIEPGDFGFESGNGANES